jgi:hypothetical protein
MSDSVILRTKKDPNCLGLPYDHYIIESRGTVMNGGIYIKKGTEVPEEITIKIKKEG